MGTAMTTCGTNTPVPRRPGPPTIRHRRFKPLGDVSKFLDDAAVSTCAQWIAREVMGETKPSFTHADLEKPIQL